ncbi:MAG: hypothetical protein HPY52_00490 [Firmicutes bacterium]|nr:hypothetical protein [Bacillota bacterium]
MTKDEFEILESRIHDELANIAHLREELEARGFLERAGVSSDRSMPGFDKADSFMLRAVGSVLHDFYMAAENIFKMIARDIDRSIPADPEWHFSLLKQMSLDLPTHRPPVLRKDTMEKLNEFRSFRHVFRNVYGFVLSADRLRLLLCKFPAATEALAEDLSTFLKAMRQAIK